MKQFLKFFIHKILIVLALFSFSVAAQVPFPAEGKIFSINNSSLNLSDMDFRVISTVKVILENNKQGSIKDLQPGDYVGVTFTKINNKEYVDTIYITQGTHFNDPNQQDPQPVEPGVELPKPNKARDR